MVLIERASRASDGRALQRNLDDEASILQRQIGQTWKETGGCYGSNCSSNTNEDLLVTEVHLDDVLETVYDMAPPGVGSGIQIVDTNEGPYPGRDQELHTMLRFGLVRKSAGTDSRTISVFKFCSGRHWLAHPCSFVRRSHGMTLL